MVANIRFALALVFGQNYTMESPHRAGRAPQSNIALLAQALTKLDRQVRHLKVCIPAKHTQILVPGTARDFHRLFEVPLWLR